MFILVFIYSYYAIFKFAPVDTKSKPIDNIEEKLRLKNVLFSN